MHDLIYERTGQEPTEVLVFLNTEFYDWENLHHHAAEVMAEMPLWHGYVMVSNYPHNNETIQLVFFCLENAPQIPYEICVDELILI